MSINDYAKAAMSAGGIKDLPIQVFETDVNPVVAGGDGGWISGTPSSLAASATVLCLFDLGPNWRQYPFLQVAVFPSGPSTGMNNIWIGCSDTPTIGTTRRLNYASHAGIQQIYVTQNSSNGCGTFHSRPMGRYVGVSITNADATNPLGASAKVTIAAYPD